MSEVNENPVEQTTQNEAPQVEQTQQSRTFDPETISKLTALGVDSNDTEALKDLGFEMDDPTPQTGEQNIEQNTHSSAQDPNLDPMAQREMGDNNSTDFLGEQADPNGEQAEPSAVVDHPLFGGKKSLVNQEPTTESNLPSSEEINKVIAERFKDQGLNSFEDLVSNYEKTRSQMEELYSIKSEYEKVEKSFENMPPELLKAISLAESGEDWKSFISKSPSIDFSQTADAIDKNALVKSYFGDKFTDEDFEAANPESDDYDPNIERMLNMAHEQAKDKFESDRKERTLTLEQASKAQQEKMKLIQESASKSLESIRSFIPDAADEYIENIGKDLLENKKDSLFSNPDGSYKEDAGLRLALAKDGIELFKQMREVINEQAQTETNLRMLLRKSDKPTESSLGSTNPSNDEIRPEVRDHIRKLTGVDI